MSINNTKPFILVDGSSYLFRAYHALPPLMTSKGMPTGAIYGVINMLKKLIAEYQPDHMAVIFDTKGETFRKKLYPAYKANRAQMPDELAVQIEPLHDLIRALGLPLIAINGVEADDVIGTLAIQAEQHGLKTLISTGDKDIAQLVNANITLINTMSNKILDIAGVKEKFGVTPLQMIDYLALVGDTSDNIPGVPKVGPKTAAKWLEAYGTLDNILEHKNEIKGKVGEYLRDSLEQLVIAKELVTIQCDIPVGIAPEVLCPGPEDKEKLKTLYEELEFNNWLVLLQGRTNSAPIPAPKTDCNYQTILTKENFDAWLEKLNQVTEFAFDTETSSLDPITADWVGLSFSMKTGEAAYLPLAHDYLGAPPQLEKSLVIAALKPLLEDPNKTIIGQNLKFDWKVLEKAGIHLKAKVQDTLLESYMLTGGNQRHDMDTLAIRYLNQKTTTFEEIAGKGVKQLSFNQIDLEQATRYAAEDADITGQLHQVLWAELSKDSKMIEILTEVELPLMKILAEMEYRGVLVDSKLLKAQSEVLKDRLGILEQEIYKEVGQEFNIASPAQLQVMLYEKLSLPVIKKTPKGQPSTSEDVLQELALSYSLPKLLLEYRSLSKLKSTYTDRLPEQINRFTGRVHTSYRQTVTTTGRLSSQDPNLQNIPIKTAAGRQIRQAFIAPPGYKIISADYSQIELRLMADLSQDASLLKAFSEGLDVHRATAAEVFGIPQEAVTSEQRRSAKAINFGLIYGMSAFGLAAQLGIDRHEAQRYIDVYFERYPGVQNYMQTIREKAREQGYVSTLLGRKLWIPDIQSKNGGLRKAAERAAINAPLQGTAADIIKLAMIAVDQWLKHSSVDAKMLMQVHDELVFEVADSWVEEAQIRIPEIMEQALSLSVPLVVAAGVGNNWDEAH